MSAPRPATPTSSYAALALIAIAVAAPFIGSFIQDLEVGGDQAILGDFVAWSLMGLFAGIAGVICAIVGALRGPRSWITLSAVVAAVLFVVAVVWVVWELTHLEL